jgi:hypothetical protein
VEPARELKVGYLVIGALLEVDRVTCGAVCLRTGSAHTFLVPSTTINTCFFVSPSNLPPRSLTQRDKTCPSLSSQDSLPPGRWATGLVVARFTPTDQPRGRIIGVTESQRSMSLEGCEVLIMAHVVRTYRGFGASTALTNSYFFSYGGLITSFHDLANSPSLDSPLILTLTRPA